MGDIHTNEKKCSSKEIIGWRCIMQSSSSTFVLNEQQSAATEQTIKTTPDFGVGQGIEWPEQVVAPFVDMTAYTSGTELSNNGALNLAAIAKGNWAKIL